MDQIEFDFGLSEGSLSTAPQGKRVGLFVTCLVDLFRPVVGFSAVKLLEDAGFEVAVPQNQTCCGQHSIHGGDRAEAKEQARQIIKTFEGYDYIVAPSQSCANIVQRQYPDLFATDQAWLLRAERLSEKCYDLVSFLYDIANIRQVHSDFQGSVAYHEMGSGPEDVQLDHKARTLLGSIDAIEIKDVSTSLSSSLYASMPSEGGLEPAIDDQIGLSKSLIAAGAGTVLSGDLGPLLDLARRLKKNGSAIEVRHLAEILADMANGPAIGEKARPLGQDRAR